MEHSDVTHGTKTLEALLLDHLPIAIVVTDSAERIAYWNREAETLYGWSRTEAQGRMAAELTGQHADASTDFSNALAGGQEWEGELSVHRKDGSTLRVYSRVAPIHDAEGTYLGLVGASLPTEAANKRPSFEGERRRQIGRRVAHARRNAGLTQDQLAERLGVTRRSVQGYEAGTVVPFRHFDRLHKLLEMPPGWFLTGGEQALGPDLAELLQEQRELLEDNLRRVVRQELSAILHSDS